MVRRRRVRGQLLHCCLYLSSGLAFEALACVLGARELLAGLLTNRFGPQQQRFYTIAIAVVQASVCWARRLHGQGVMPMGQNHLSWRLSPFVKLLLSRVAVEATAGKECDSHQGTCCEARPNSASPSARAASCVIISAAAARHLLCGCCGVADDCKTACIARK